MSAFNCCESALECTAQVPGKLGEGEPEQDDPQEVGQEDLPEEDLPEEDLPEDDTPEDDEAAERPISLCLYKNKKQ